MTCGLRSNPKGMLHVAATSAAPAKPSPIDLVGPIAEYKVYVTDEVDDAGRGDEEIRPPPSRPESSQKPRRPTRRPISTTSASSRSRNCSTISTAPSIRAPTISRRRRKIPNSPAFIGSSTACSPTSDRRPGAGRRQLMADTLDLQKRHRDADRPPKKMVGGAADLIEEVASNKITGEEDRYSHTDLWDFQANVDGAQKIVALLRPLTSKRTRNLAPGSTRISPTSTWCWRSTGEGRRFREL